MGRSTAFGMALRDRVDIVTPSKPSSRASSRSNMSTPRHPTIASWSRPGFLWACPTIRRSCGCATRSWPRSKGPTARPPWARCATRGQQVGLVIGRTLNSAEEIGNLELTARDGRTVYVRDVADVALQTDLGGHHVATLPRAPKAQRRPAVAKRSSANAVVVADEILHRVHTMEGQIIPGSIRSRARAIMARRPMKRRTSCCSTWGWRPFRSSFWCWSPSAGARLSWLPSSFRSPSC